MGDALFVGGGVTSPKEARLASGGLLALQGSSLLDVRTGVLFGPGSTGLVTGTTDTGPMTVAIAAHVPVTSRGVANGPYIGPVPEAVTKVPIGAAPGANSRIDVVYEKQQDATTDVSPDTTTAPLFGVLQGTVSVTPVKPDLSTIPGALELATVQVSAGATSTNGTGVTIANTARQTVPRGVPIPVRTQAEQLALTAYNGLAVLRLDTGNIERYRDGWVYESGPVGPPWLPLTLASGASGGGAGVDNAGYRQVGDKTELRGRITVGAAFTSVATTVATVPIQPKARKVYLALLNGNNFAQLLIETTGAITVSTNAAGATTVYLDGVSFSTTA